MPPLAPRRLDLIAVLLVVTVAPAASAQSPYVVAAPAPPGFDRASAQRITREHLERLVRLDTQNPPGNEMRTARYFDSVFRSIPGVETHILDVGDGRANFIARLRAQRSTKRPVLLMGHMDVVGADSAKWSTNPFAATERDGYLYGRGTIDDKGMLAAATTAITSLAARRAALARDIIFLATAGEEGGPAVGIDRVLEQHFDHLRDVEFALNEGGRIRIIGGRIRSVNIQTTEKVSYSVVATARGPSGHGSVPLPENALASLARSVSRVHQWRAPAKLNDVTRLYFSRLAEIDTNPELRDAMRRLSAPDASGETLKETGRAGGQARALTRLRRALVISEVALATITLSTAGLMMRSFANMQAIDLGFDPKNILTVRVSLPASEYEGEKSVLLYQMALQRVRALSGVRSAAIVGDLPVRDGWASWSILIDGAPMTSVAAAPSAMPQQVSPGYFETMGIQLVRGRTFSEADRAGAPLVAVVNETMEKTLWPGKSAIGGTVKMLYEKSPWATVVGVVKDVREGGFLSEPPPAMFFPHAQSGLSAYYWPSDMNLVIRTEGSPLRLIGAVRQIVRELEPSAPLAQIQSMDQVVAKSVASRRFSTQLLLGFATVALVLAGIGIYGVIAYGVTQRKFELGLRMALGAQRGSVLRFVLSEGVRLAAVGLAIGIAGAWGVARLMRALFVQVGPGDPITLTSVAVAMAVVALAASWVPARRATIVDPMRAMRAE